MKQNLENVSLPGLSGQSTRQRTASGFTLIELIMTIVIVAIVSVPLTLMLYEHVEAVFLAQDDVLSLQLARYEIERLNKMSFANIATSSQTDYLGSGYDLDVTVTYAEGSAVSAESLKDIVVEVTRTGESGVLVELETYVVKNVAFGQ